MPARTLRKLKTISSPQNGNQSPNSDILETVKTLVVAFGPREAARQSGINPFTVLSWCRRYNWKKADKTAPKQLHSNAIKFTKSPSEAVETAILSHKGRSRLAMGKYTAEASERAASSNGDLSKARHVRDLAAIYQTVWPEEKSGNLLAIGVLVGTSPVTDDPEQDAKATTIDV
jgi:hypothetical protein